MGGIKLTLDLAIGETSAIESTDKGKIQDIVKRVKDLNGRLQDIRREQVFQRVSASLFELAEKLVVRRIKSLSSIIPCSPFQASILLSVLRVALISLAGTRSRIQRSI